MAKVNGWFAKLKDQASVDSPISSFEGEGWEIEGTISRNDTDKQRWLFNNANTYIRVGGASGAIDYLQGGTATSSWVNTQARYSRPSHIILRGGATGIQAIVDGVDEFENGTSNKRIYVQKLNGDVGNDITLSHTKITDPDGTVQAEWDGNYVLNAAGDGFVTRTAANADPSIAQPNYNLRMYDISGNGHHATLQATTTWEFVSSVGLPEEVIAGTSNNFTAPDGFTVTGVTLGGYSVPFTFNAGDGTGTFDAPELGVMSDFPLFGSSVQVQLTDSSNGNTAEANADWKPPAPYSYRLFTSSPDTGSVNNAYYEWVDPPVSGNMAVFDASLYKIESNGKLVINEDSPASFAVQEYLIDEDGMQQFERNSGAAEQVGELPEITLNGSATVTVTQGAGYIDEGADWEDAEDGTGTVYSGTVVDDQTPAGQYTLRYSYTDSDGNTASASRLVNVEAVQVILPTVSQTTQPQTVTVGQQINVSATASDYDTFQWTADLDGTFEDENALTTTFTTAEHGQLTTTATAINAEGSRSDSVTHTVEEPIAMGQFTATHNNVPDGSIETVVVNLDTSAVLFNGSKTWTDGKATFSFENLAAGDRLQVTTINEPDGDAGLSVEYAA